MTSDIRRLATLSSSERTCSDVLARLNTFVEESAYVCMAHSLNVKFYPVVTWGPRENIYIKQKWSFKQHRVGHATHPPVSLPPE